MKPRLNVPAMKRKRPTMKETILAIRIQPPLRNRIRRAAKASEQTESGFARKHLGIAAESVLAGGAEP